MATERRISLLTVELHEEADVVLARQRARQIADLLGLKRLDRTRFTTSVSEIVRNAYEYAGGGRVEFEIKGSPPRILCVRVVDQGPGIAHLNAVLSGQYLSRTGMGLGIVGARRLSDRFRIDSTPGGGTTVEIEKDLPRLLPGERTPDLANLAQELARQSVEDPFEENRLQNQDLLHALEGLQTRQQDLDQINRELSDTNRGVMALYAELDEKNQELQRASEMKTRFLSDMSHEFRTPLNSIMGLARLLMERADGPLTAEQEKQVGFIHRSAQQLADLVNDLLDTAKIEAGKVTVQAQEFTASDLFSSLRGVFRPLVGTTGEVTLLFDDVSDLPTLNTDEGKVSQILRNFISNALKFTERGTVRVTATAGFGDTIVFSVSDTGIGIAPADQQRIFESFIQVEGEAQRRVKGTGLGLPLSRRLAELLGGSISLTSRVGSGSTFALTIPLRYIGATETESNPRDGMGMLRGAKYDG